MWSKSIETLNPYEAIKADIENEYIYKVEIGFFKEDGVYWGNLLCRKKSDCNDKWRISSFCLTSTLEDVFEWAEEWKDVYGE